jgi:hypothetical protein
MEVRIFGKNWSGCQQKIKPRMAYMEIDKGKTSYMYDVLGFMCIQAGIDRQELIKILYPYHLHNNEYTKFMEKFRLQKPSQLILAEINDLPMNSLFTPQVYHKLFNTKEKKLMIINSSDAVRLANQPLDIKNKIRLMNATLSSSNIRLIYE